MSSGTKTDNAFLSSKLALRRHFLKKYHADARPYVLDCCMGNGVIWSELRQEFGFDYWGVDVKPKKGRLKIDSVRILAQPGWPQDVIDCDTYGSPWKHWHALLPNVVKPTTVFLTTGLVRMGGGNCDAKIIEALGLQSLKHLPSSLAVKVSDLGIMRILTAATRHGLELVEAAEAPRGPNARYIGVHLRPLKSPAA